MLGQESSVHVEKQNGDISCYRKTLEGKVAFNLGKISIPNFEPVIYKGELRRLKPRLDRGDVALEDVKRVEPAIYNWIEPFFGTESNVAYLKEIVNTTCIVIACVYPSQPIGSKKWILAAKMILWLWIQDDILESIISDSNISVETLEKGTDQLSQVLRDSKSDFVEVDGFPIFRNLFQCIASIHQHYLENDPDYTSKSGTYCFFMERYYDGMRWYVAHPVNGDYSEDSYFSWRKLLCLLDGTVEILWILDCETALPEKVLKSPSFHRLWDITNTITCYTNDLIGVKNEVYHEKTDNIVLFKVCQKKISVEEAVAQTCKLINDGLADYLLLRDSILKEFPYQRSLYQYFDLLESMIDGHNLLYTVSARYKVAGCVILVE